MTIRECIAAARALPKPQWIPYEVQHLAETYRIGFARWEMCPGCANSFLRAPNGPAYTNPALDADARWTQLAQSESTRPSRLSRRIEPGRRDDDKRQAAYRFPRVANPRHQGPPVGIRPEISDADLLPMGWNYRKTTNDEAWREIAKANQPGART